MNTLDIILLVLLLIAAAAGWRKGIIVQACCIAGLVLGILFAMRFSRTIGRWLGAGDTVSPVLGFILILAVSILVLALVGYLFQNDEYHWVEPAAISDSVVYPPLRKMTDTVFPFLLKAKEKLFDQTPAPKENEEGDTRLQSA